MTLPPLKPFNRRSVRIFWGLFLITALLRLPFVSRILYHWDSVNFAMGLNKFDVAAGQPHVPGYILYVFLGKLVNFIFHDPQVTLVAISIISSGLAVAWLYLLGRDFYNDQVGLLAALFLLSSPLFWFYGEIALPHTLDAFVVILTIWLSYRLMLGQYQLLVPAAVWLAVAGGFRPQTEIFLAPLALLVAWRIGWRRSLIALGILVVVNLIWFIPLITLSGGLSRYLQVMGAFSQSFDATTTIFSGGLWGLTRNVRKLSMYTLYGWAGAVVPALIGAYVILRKRSSWRFESLKNLRLWVYILWMVPTLGFYTFIHMGQQGLVFVFLPALLLLGAAGLCSWNWRRSITMQGLASSLIAINALVFIVAPTYPLGAQSIKLLTWDTLRQHDAHLIAAFEAIPSNFSPQNTLIIASNWRFPQYYIPQFTLVQYDLGARWEITEGKPTLTQDEWVDPIALGLNPDSDGNFHLVIFDQELLAYNQSILTMQPLPLSTGENLEVISFGANERLFLSPEYFALQPVSSSLP